MATGKKYYWLKLRTDFLDGDTIDFLMSQKNGSEYVVLYLMLVAMTINTKGKLAKQIGEILIPYDVNKIQRETKFFNVDTIRVAFELYQKLGLIYEDNDQILCITHYDDMVGKSSNWAEQKARQRLKQAEQKALKNNNGGDKEVDKEVDIVHLNVHPEYKSIRVKDIRDKECYNQEYQSSVCKKKDRILKENKVNIKNIQTDKTDNIILNNINKEDFTTDFYDTIDTIDHNNDDISLYAYGGYQNVMLTMAQVDSLELDYGAKTAEKYIEKASKFIKFKAPNIKKSHYEMIKKWIDEDRAV
ncbi:MAG: phage replisome organizer N-terminal domain-containing protein [Candidatus Fimenecus sp.]